MEMEMEMGMDSLSFYQHLPMNFPPSPCSASGQEALSYYYNPPFPAAITNKRDDVDPTPPSLPLPPRQKAAVVARRGRNSKICTAGGMRDRRMRLSLHVARRFFALQDKLGFDKASKTVQWLLDMSTTGVNDLPTASMSLSEEDATSGSVLLDNNDHFLVAGAISAERNNCKQQMPKARKGAPVLQDKESRTRARERARERTKERKRLRTSVSIAEEALAPARQVIPVPAAACSSSFEHGSGSYYDEQEPWELGGVVFANSRFH